ncbi:MAG: hypothetical protein IKO67_00595 [Bacteroidaceae bacterium]|nr:hypothetical protein [Bacteroidaceae bacterium]
MLQFTCENLAVFSVGFAFLKSDERLDDLMKRYTIAGNIGGVQVMLRLDKGMLSKYHLAMVGGQQKALPCQVDEDDKGVTKCYALGAPRGHADKDKEDKQGERIVHRQVSDRMIRTVTDSISSEVKGEGLAHETCTHDNAAFWNVKFPNRAIFTV